MDDENTKNEIEKRETAETSQKPENNDIEETESHLISRSEEFRAIMMQGGLPGMNIADKIQPEHIEKMLENDAKKNELQSKDNHENRILAFGIVLVAVILLIVFAIIFKDDVASMKEIITPILTFFAGAGGGFGVGYWKSKHNDSDD